MNLDKRSASIRTPKGEIATPRQRGAWRSKRAISTVDEVRDQSEHRDQEHDGEPKEAVHAANPGVLVDPQPDEQEGDVQAEKEKPESDGRARRGRLERGRDVSQNDGHLAHPTTRSLSRGIPASNIYIIMREFVESTGGRLVWPS